MSILEKSIDDESEEPLRIVSDVVCPACGCVCDDLTLTFRGNQLAGVSSGCRLGDEWFERHSKNEGPASCVRGIESSFDEAIRVASEILTEAKYPLIFGLSRSSTGGQRAAVTLADRIGAVVDTTASLCHGPSIIALQSVGESTCSLGETRNRADLVIFWGCNPGESHPRHAERYSVFPHGQFISSRDDRTVVMIGDAEEVHHWRLDQKGSLPDLFIPVERDRDFEIITELRAMLQDRFTSSNSFRSESSSRVHPQQSDLETLIRLMTGCR
ncbi:MAG: hypothetical protein FJ267_16685, partial [Planctomycetes bacterium]|nr:hypothetical protein [Planctomycetota bacterium]